MNGTTITISLIVINIQMLNIDISNDIIMDKIPIEF